MIKRSSLLLTAFLLSALVRAQIYDPVTWNFRYEKTGDHLFELIFVATIEEGSHIYSMDVPEGGPIPTTFSFDTTDSYTLEGKPYEVTRPDEKYDEAFGFKIKSFTGTAEFRQKIRANAPSFTVRGIVNFMSCNNSTCSPPKDVEIIIPVTDPDAGAQNAVSGDMDLTAPVPKRGLLGFFLLSLFAGLAGILTPCVFPMIPMTVAFFSRESGNKARALVNALAFGISIVVIYTALGVIVSLTSAGAGIANALSTHWIPNIIFFGLFVAFAVSFFGAFEIVLPNKWVSGADARVDKGGVFASFFMGLTTVIVSFSCTGPIVGALLVEAASGDVIRPAVGMFGFGLAFALPFTLFALFPSILNRMPKSGGWLNSVKVVLGFLMLAFSMKFIMTIDSVYSLGILSRDLYLAIWIVLFTLLGFYLLGKIKFAHDSDLPYVGTFRLFLVIAVFSFVLILITGLFGAPLKGLSALLPPRESSWFAEKQITTVQEQGVPAFSGTNPVALCSEPKYSDKFTLPYGLRGYFDYTQGLACASLTGKPALLDFKGHACANCKLMEAKVWSDPQVLQRLRDNFVIISLYADDRTQLPEDEWFVSNIDGKVKKTIGKQNEDIEISKYNTNALPLYVITDGKGNPVIRPMPTNLKVEEYMKWLDEGLRLFNENKE